MQATPEIGKIYALLVGIDQYHPDTGVPPLKGCCNDVRAMESWLLEHFAEASLEITLLLNEEATYDNLLAHLGPAFLGQAKQTDTVLFMFNGHGSREEAAPEFAPYFPERKEETLVCYDSRLPDRFDLADKELALFLEAISVQGPHITVILDCCHAGSGTKAVPAPQLAAVRQWEDQKRRRPLGSYAGGRFLRGGAYVPNSRHILLAACQRREKAFELRSGHGHFSWHLLQTLQEKGGAISYAALFTDTRLAMRQVTDKQNPQFETSGLFNAYQGFLGSHVESKEAPFRMQWHRDHWSLNAGAIHGLPTLPGQQATFEVFQEGQSRGFAQTLSVGLNQARVQPDFPADPNRNYLARLISLPLPGLPVWVQVDETGQERWEAAQSQYRPVHFQLVTAPGPARFSLSVKASELQIHDHQARKVVRTVTGADEERAFQDVFEVLEKLGWYEKVRQLTNPGTPLDSEKVSLRIEILSPEGRPVASHASEEVTVAIPAHGQIPFRLLVANGLDQSIQVVLFYLSPDFGIFKVYQDEVPEKATAIALDRDPKGDAYTLELRGQKESHVRFLLLASLQPVDDFLMEQSPIPMGQQVDYPRVRAGSDPAAGRFLERFFSEKEKQADPETWFTQPLLIELRESQEISNEWN